jgi:ComF family protein
VPPLIGLGEPDSTGWRRLVQTLLRLLLPPRCLGCARRGTLLCRTCWQLMPWLPSSVCARCAGRRWPGERCPACPRISAELTAVRAACSYAGPVRSAVHALKFRAGRQAAPVLGALIRESLRQRPLKADLVVPVPLAPGRLRRRGYNQAALLAEQLGHHLGGPLELDLLGREDRPAQRTLGAAERWANLRGSIHCRAPTRVVGRRIIVVDDVMTTGATLSACAEALAAAGARQVFGLVVARTL